MKHTQRAVIRPPFNMTAVRRSEVHGGLGRAGGPGSPDPLSCGRQRHEFCVEQQPPGGPCSTE
jgi:hypothetical protein